MARQISNGKMGLRLRSDNKALREVAKQVPLVPSIVHEKGRPYAYSKGKVAKFPAREHYVAFEPFRLDDVADANARIAQILAAIRDSGLAPLIASGEIRAEIDLAAFSGHMPWESGLDPVLVEAARVANVALWIEHYDRFTEDGRPLAVKL
jgi:hypothetical protein